MLSDKKQAIIREIWNSRFTIHSLKPSQTKVTRVSIDSGVLKFHLVHQIVPTPLPTELFKPTESTRKRELKLKPVKLSELLLDSRITTLSVSKRLPLEEALIQRFAQMGIIITALKAERVGEKKSLYRLSEVKSPFLTAGFGADLTIHQVDEDLLAADYISGNYNVQKKILRLTPNSVHCDGKFRHVGLVSWKPKTGYMKMKACQESSLHLYDVHLDRYDDYDGHLALMKSVPKMKFKLSEGDYFELKYTDEGVIFSHNGEVIENFGLLDETITLAVIGDSVLPRDHKFEATSMEQV